MDDDLPIPISLTTFRSMYWMQAFLKAAIVSNGGRITVDMSLFRSIFDQTDEMELFFDKTGSDVSCIIIRGDTTVS